jgi:hypothetical protein
LLTTLNAKFVTGTDIGDVTINNAIGAAAVPIQDGGNSITVDGPLTDTQLRATAVPISAASLPLPSGAATSALQGGGLPALLGQGTMAQSLAVVPPSNLTDPTYIGDIKFGEALPAGEAHVGAIGGNMVSISVTPTLTVAGAYTSGDYVGTSATAMDFVSMGRVAAGSGIIMRAIMIDKAAQAKATELWLFTVAPAGLPADNAAFTITDADVVNCIAVIQFSVWFSSALNSISIGEIRNGQAPFVCAAADQSIFGVLVTRDAPTYANGDVVIVLIAAQD